MKKISYFFILLLLSSCYYVPDKIEPRVSVYVEQRYIDSLNSPFSSLTAEEKKEDWGREYMIALKFAKCFDLYRAISTFKRAEVLIEDPCSDRALEISYFITLAYYLGGKYQEAVQNFENSELTHIDEAFPPYHDLMLLLAESYGEIGEEERSQKIEELLQRAYPETYEDMDLALAMKEGNMEVIESYAHKRPYLEDLLCEYKSQKKSVALAQGLNALLPGSGYLYLGQKKSALTAFLLNGLFIYSAYYFFQKGNIAAGAITVSFEAGWYFGGIYGAGESAKYYNERIYEKYATPLMNEKKLFPVFMLQYGF